MDECLIETRSLTRRFGTQLAVNDLNLLVPGAGVYGFLGPNGAGKTTAIRLLLGLIRSDAGEVRLFGSPLAANRQSLMRRVGALVEAPSLYPHLTGRENLEVTRRLLGAPPNLIDSALNSFSLGAGIGGTFFALFAAGASLGKYYPWLLPMNIFLEGRLRVAILLGVIGGLVAALVGCIEFVRRDVA
jgi:ABC-type Fe3+/spermidine/putrescine transport system ATPase subunit